jgi:hypothetical protein
MRSRSRWTSGSVPAASRARCHRVNAHSRNAPTATTNGVGENPKGAMGACFGTIHPQALARSTPNTINPSPSEDSTTPRRSRRGRSGPAGASPRNRTASRMPRTMTTSPTNTTRQLKAVGAQPPTIGPTAIPAPATPPITA